MNDVKLSELVIEDVEEMIGEEVNLLDADAVGDEGIEVLRVLEVVEKLERLEVLGVLEMLKALDRLDTLEELGCCVEEPVSELPEVKWDRL